MNGWWLVTTAAQMLHEHEREAVLGDLAEAADSSWRGVCDVFGLVVRREAALWTSWRPWLAAFGIALPASLLLMGVSVSVSLGLQNTVALRPLLSRIVLLLGGAWTAGWMAGWVSWRTIWATALLAALPCLFCLSSFRMPSLSPVSLLLFLPPAIWGVRSGLRRAVTGARP